MSTRGRVGGEGVGRRNGGREEGKEGYIEKKKVRMEEGSEERLYNLKY